MLSKDLGLGNEDMLLLSHKTATLQPTESALSRNLTTADIIGRLVMYVRQLGWEWGLFHRTVKPVYSGHPSGPKQLIIQCNFYRITALGTKEFGCIREVTLIYRLAVWLH